MRNVRSSNPSYFGSESFDVILLSVQDGFGNKHWEVSVVDSQCFTVSSGGVTIISSDSERDRLSLKLTCVDRTKLHSSNDHALSVHTFRDLISKRTIERTLNLLPNPIRPRFEDITTRNIIIIQHLSFDQYLLMSLTHSHYQLLHPRRKEREGMSFFFVYLLIPFSEISLFLLDGDSELYSCLTIEFSRDRLLLFGSGLLDCFRSGRTERFLQRIRISSAKARIEK